MQLLPAGATPVAGTLKELDGKLALLSSLRGQVAVLDFFATWCEPCRAGLPHTQALVASLAPRGVTGWAISIDDTLEKVPPFAQELKLNIPVRWDPDAKVADALGIQLLPTLLLLDRRGAVRYRALPDDAKAEEHLQEALALLLAEAAP